MDDIFEDAEDGFLTGIDEVGCDFINEVVVDDSAFEARSDITDGFFIPHSRQRQVCGPAILERCAGIRNGFDSVLEVRQLEVPGEFDNFIQVWNSRADVAADGVAINRGEVFLCKSVQCRRHHAADAAALIANTSHKVMYHTLPNRRVAAGLTDALSNGVSP